MPTRDQVLGLLDADLTYEQVGQRLRISPGLAYMIATGLPADGGDVPATEQRNRPGYVAGSTQHLANRVQPHNPTSKPQVAAWIKQRVAADTQMTAAAGKSGKHAKTAKR